MSSEQPQQPPCRLELTHIDAEGAAQMVNVSSKPLTRRQATASAICRMLPATAAAIQANSIAKGDVLSVARIAAIQAAKRTDELIPLCHSLPLDGISVDFQWISMGELKISVTVTVTARTGVEMEAMVGASVAGLTVYDMCKAIDRSMTVESIVLESKTGGASGEFQRPEKLVRP
jgi:cyclic pyranopterin monophosphate synthase